MELIDSKQMKKADQKGINEYGIPGIVLMENAATQALRAIEEKYGSLCGKKIILLCGPGNNGGDGYAVARKIFLKGGRVSIYAIAQIDDLPDDARVNAKICQQLKIPIHVKQRSHQLKKDVKDAFMIIDGLLGIGVTRNVEGLMAEYIHVVNDAKIPIISLDIPSGLHADKGIPMGTCIHAQLTLCFGRGKIGVFTEPGCVYASLVVVKSIDLPKQAYEKTTFFAYDEAMALSHIKQRDPLSSKGDYGRIAILAGSPGMTGAMKLCTKACIRSGAGLVYVLAPKSRYHQYEKVIDESITKEIDDDHTGWIGHLQADAIKKACLDHDVMIMGPGVHPKAKLQVVMKEMLENTHAKLVIDATALDHIKENLSLLKNQKQRVVVTPHPGEMSRLMDCSIEEIQNDRIEKAKEFAVKHQVIVVLKGHRTIVTDGNDLYINTSGNPGMASGGSGDVLTGMIGAYAGRKDMDLLQACTLAVYIHGKAGDLAAKKMGMTGLKAGDIIKNITKMEKELYEKNARSCLG